MHQSPAGKANSFPDSPVGWEIAFLSEIPTPITVFVWARHWSLYRNKWTQSTPSYTVSLISVLILFSKLRQCYQTYLNIFQQNSKRSSQPCVLHTPLTSCSLIDRHSNSLFTEHKLWSSWACSFLQLPVTSSFLGGNISAPPSQTLTLYDPSSMLRPIFTHIQRNRIVFRHSTPTFKNRYLCNIWWLWYHAFHMATGRWQSE
jgi:hypothetical protein